MDTDSKAPEAEPALPDGLRELQAELAGVHASPWQPRCVARAFRSAALDGHYVFRMQTWIDLDAVQSPFLQGRLPEPEKAVAAFEQAFAAFGHNGTTPAACEPHGLILLGQRMIEAIERGFAMRLRMNPPKGFESAGGVDDGFGDWLPVMACLKAQMGFGWSEALALPVEQALAVMNAHRRNEGWSPAETTYAMRNSNHG